MPEILNEFNFEKSNRSKYPMEEWADGQIRKLYIGKDFNCSLSTLKHKLMGYAKETGRVLRSKNLEDGNIVIQFKLKERTTQVPSNLPNLVADLDEHCGQGILPALLKVSSASIKNWKAGKSNPSQDYLERLLEAIKAKERLAQIKNQPKQETAGVTLENQSPI